MNQTITLSQLNESIKDALIEAFPATVWVVAEMLTHGCNTDTPQAPRLLKKVQPEIVEVLPVVLAVDIFPANV